MTASGRFEAFRARVRTRARAVVALLDQGLIAAEVAALRRADVRVYDDDAGLRVVVRLSGVRRRPASTAELALRVRGEAALALSDYLADSARGARASDPLFRAECAGGAVRSLTASAVLKVSARNRSRASARR